MQAREQHDRPSHDGSHTRSLMAHAATIDLRMGAPNRWDPIEVPVELKEAWRSWAASRLG